MTRTPLSSHEQHLGRATVAPQKGLAMPTNLPRETGWKPYSAGRKLVSMEKLVRNRRGI